MGDVRLTKRVMWLVDRMMDDPAASFPNLAKTESELEAIYRLMRNRAVTMEAILAPHIQAAGRRAAGELVLVVHDTTELKHNYADQKDMGRLRGGQQGFLGHFSLGVRPGPERMPLGLLASTTWKRDQAPTAKVTKKDGTQRRRSGVEYAELEESESNRWWEGVEQAEKALPPTAQAIHVMDREADIYALLVKMGAAGHRFVIRQCRQRRIRKTGSDAKVKTLKEAVAGAKVLLEREAPVAHRSAKSAPRAATRQPEREARVARLAATASRVVFERPRYLKELPDTIEVNVVHVYEVEAPEGEAPIEWMLMTTEPVDTANEVAAVIDAYRSRWTIEDYFKAIKTGCSYSKRQLESYQTLRIALAISAFVAWQLLLLRSQARATPTAPAESVLAPAQLEALRRVSKRKLPPTLTVAAAFAAFAQLGGHQPSNGTPGWLVLTRGFHKVMQFLAGYRSATEELVQMLHTLGLLELPDVREQLRQRMGHMSGDVAKGEIDG